LLASAIIVRLKLLLESVLAINGLQQNQISGGKNWDSLQRLGPKDLADQAVNGGFRRRAFDGRLRTIGLEVGDSQLSFQGVLVHSPAKVVNLSRQVRSRPIA